MIRRWTDIAVDYETHASGRASLEALGSLARWVGEGPLVKGLFAWKSMHTLCLVQHEVSYPYDGPHLTITPLAREKVEFRYVDTPDKAKQWQRIVDSHDVQRQLSKFLDQLRWFPSETLKALEPPESGPSDSIQADIGTLIAELEALGLEVTASRYDAQAFGNYYIDLSGTAGSIRITRDRGQYMIDADERQLRQRGLFRAFDDLEEFRVAVLAYVRTLI
jgi:hypothetical protein